MEKQAFEPTGLIPRSIIRTVDRFVQQLLPGREKIALQEYRVSRYQILVSIKSLLTLVLIPILVSSTMKALLFTPLVEHFWNNNQSEIFLNQYQEKRAFSEMHDFSEKMFFESLLIEPKIKSNPLEIENLDTRNILNPPYSTVFYANELGTKHSKNQSINAVHLPTFVAYKAELCTYKQSDRSLANDAPLNLQFPKTINISSDLQYSSTLLQRSFDSRFSHVRAFATSTELFQGLQSLQSFASFVPALYAKRSFPFAPTKLDAFPHPRLYKPIRFASANFVSCCKGTYNKAGTKLAKLCKLCEVHALCKPCHVPTPVTLQGGTVCIGELCNGFTNPKGDQGFVLSTLLPLRDAPNHVLCKPTVCNGLQSGALYVQRKERGCRALSLRPKRSFGKPLQTVNLQKTWLANPLHGVTPCKAEQSFATGCISKQTGFVPVLYDNNNKLLSYSHFTENDKYETLFQRKSLELAKSYNKQSILAITNLLGDFLTFFTVSVLFRIMRPELIILKSFLTESVYSLSDTTKSFLLILGMDLLVGFHSPRGWELLLEGFLRHIGLPENENFILLFVALFPVFLDTVFKYWIFRYLNKISPSTVVTYHSMIE